MSGTGQVEQELPVPGDPGPAGGIRPRTRRRSSTSGLADARPVLAVMSLGMVAVGLVLATDAPEATTLSILTTGLSFALYVASGLVASLLRPDNRVGMLMVLTGYSMWLAFLVYTPYPALALIGAMCASLSLALVVHLLLAFPSGVVPRGIARWTVGVGYFVSIVLEVSRYLLGSQRFSLFPGVPDDVIVVAQWVQVGLGIGTLVATAAIFVTATLRYSAQQRRLLGPLLWYRIVVPVSIAVTAIGITSSPPDSVAFFEFQLVQAISLASLPVVFLAGLLRGSFGRSGEVRDLVVQLGDGTPRSGDLSAAIAAALGDPSATVLVRRGDEYVGETGQERPTNDHRLIQPVRYNGTVVGAIAYDGTLLSRDARLEEIGRIVAMCLEQRRLAAEQEQALADLDQREEALRRSRRRLVQAADIERRRIARDLHDGAQQHLVALGLRARQLSRRSGDPTVAAGIATVADGLTTLNNELRHLVAGIMPDALMQGGLAAAVHTLAERMPIPTQIQVDDLPVPLPADGESAAYFTVAEALTNAAKHAAATTVDVEIRHLPGRLTVTVTDNGVGRADPARGSGLTGLADRIGALGGVLRIESAPGRGTRIRAVLPLENRADRG